MSSSINKNGFTISLHEVSLFINNKKLCKKTEQKKYTFLYILILSNQNFFSPFFTLL